MTVYVVLGDCRDYYCEGMHLLAVCTDEAKAQEIVDAANRGNRWSEVYVDDHETDVALEALER